MRPKHYDTILMCMTASQILYAFRLIYWTYTDRFHFLKKRYAFETLAPDYQKFLLVHGGMPKIVNDTYKAWAHDAPPDIVELR